MKKCGSCFRYTEDWRDVKVKGIEPRYTLSGDYSYKPRKGVKPHGMGVNCPEDIKENCKACKYHKYRLVWNFETWYRWHFKQSIREWYRVKIRVPLGNLRKPVKLNWIDSFNGMTDEIIRNGEPQCPRCKEMPYSTEQCVFCGQRFIKD